MTRAQLQALSQTTYEEVAREVKDERELVLIAMMQLDIILTLVNYISIFHRLPIVLRALANAIDVIIKETTRNEKEI